MLTVDDGRIVDDDCWCVGRHEFTCEDACQQFRGVIGDIVCAVSYWEGLYTGENRDGG